MCSYKKWNDNNNNNEILNGSIIRVDGGGLSVFIDSANWRGEL